MFSNSEEGGDFAQRFPLGYWSSWSWWRRKASWNSTLQSWRTLAFYCRCHGCQFRRQRTSSLQSFQWVGSGFLEKGRRKKSDSLQCWTFKRRACFSHDQLCKSAQHLRSNRGLVWWIDTAWRNPLRKWMNSNVSSFSFDTWQIVRYTDIDICTQTRSLPCCCLAWFFLLQLIHRQTQLSCTMPILTRVRTCIEQALSSIFLCVFAK